MGVRSTGTRLSPSLKISERCLNQLIYIYIVSKYVIGIENISPNRSQVSRYFHKTVDSIDKSRDFCRRCWPQLNLALATKVSANLANRPNITTPGVGRGKQDIIFLDNYRKSLVYLSCGQVEGKRERSEGILAYPNEIYEHLNAVISTQSKKNRQFINSTKQMCLGKI